MSEAESDRLSRFVLVSRLLIDARDLESRTATTYLAMMDDLDPTWPLTDIAAAFALLEPLPPDPREAKIVALLQAKAAWMTAATNILNVWYSGQLARADGTWVPAPPNAYLDALVWPLIGTHASGLPGPFFGEWAYPPSPEPSSGEMASPDHLGASQ